VRVVAAIGEWYSFCAFQAEYCPRKALLLPTTGEEVAAFYTAEMTQFFADMATALPLVDVGR
jgi:hypothetical protein